MNLRDENIRFAEQFRIAPEAFSAPAITVELPSDAASPRGNRAAFLLAVNLLARTFETVHAVFPAGTQAPQHPWKLDALGDGVDELQGTAAGTLRVGPPKHSDVVLAIGARPSTAADREVVVRGSHWRAALDCDLEGAGEGVLGSLYGACMGAAQILLHVLNGINAPYQPMPAFNFSLLDLLVSGADAPTPEPIRLPEAHLVGVGAVGSAAIYALAHLDDVGGVLHLIDNEEVDEGNLNRYVLMRHGDVGCAKVHVAGEALRSTGIQARPYRGAFRSYGNEHGTDVGLLLSPVDSEEGRRALAKMLPRRVINAATGGTTVTVSTHGFADGRACLHCLYVPQPNRASAEETMAADMGLPTERILELVETNAPLDTELAGEIERNRGVEPGTWTSHVGSPIGSFYAKAVCGDASVVLPTASVIAPLSFISASAGILLAAELVKTGHPALRSWALDNYLRIDTLRPPNPEFRRVRPEDPSGRCICADPDFIDVYSQKYASP